MCLYMGHTEEGSFIVQLNITYSGLQFYSGDVKIYFTIRKCSKISGVCDHVSASTVECKQPLRDQNRTAWLNIIQCVNTYFKPTPVNVHDCGNCEKKKQKKTKTKQRGKYGQ